MHIRAPALDPAQAMNRTALLALSLMLNGQDAMNRQTMEKLQGFVGEQAQRMRPRD